MHRLEHGFSTRHPIHLRQHQCAPRGALYHSEALSSRRTAVSVTRRHATGVKHTSGEPRADWHPVCRCPFDRPPVLYGMSLFVGPTIVVRSPHGRANVPGSISMDPTITSREIFEKIKQEHDALREVPADS